MFLAHLDRKSGRYPAGQRILKMTLATNDSLFALMLLFANSSSKQDIGWGHLFPRPPNSLMKTVKEAARTHAEL